MLGAVSDEDILKLTQLTAEVTTELKQPKAHRHRQGKITITNNIDNKVNIDRYIK
jgi:hypothetical protein